MSLNCLRLITEVYHAGFWCSQCLTNLIECHQRFSATFSNLNFDISPRKSSESEDVQPGKSHCAIFLVLRILTPCPLQVEMLPSVDAEGRAMPGAFGRDAAGKGQIDGGRKVKKLQRYEDGEKHVYFADDNNQTLDDLVREQRHGGRKHMDDNLAENISRKARFRWAAVLGCCGSLFNQAPMPKSMNSMPLSEAFLRTLLYAY